MASPSVSTSGYLAAKTQSITNQSPVDPSAARAAQVPLQNFSLPNFPPEAFSAGLTQLILTADIKLEEYTDLLTTTFSVPDLPASITALTLELFSLGYPPGFLTSLGQNLPNLKALTLYSQLLAGTTPLSRDDAVAFLQGRTALQELHLLDVFGSPGFLADVGGVLTSGLRFLEINYTFRHSDPEFVTALPSKEIHSLIGERLVGLTLSVSAPGVSERDQDDREGTEVGVLVVGRREGEAVVKRLVAVGASLMMLDLTMFELGLEEVESLLDACARVKVLGLSVALEKGWDEVLDVLGKKERGLEVVELVGVPSQELVKGIRSGCELVLSKEVLGAVTAKCNGIRSVKVSILRTKTEQWVRETSGAWERID